MIELQDVYRGRERPVIHFSTRRAGDQLNVTQRTAAKAFQDLIAGGFIEVVNESSLEERKAREYLLTWMPAYAHEPTDEWRELGRINAQKLDCAGSESSRERVN